MAHSKEGGRCSIVTPWPYSAGMIAICGAALVPVGLYFALWRPRFLPEDARFTGAPLAKIEAVAPTISPWLGLVFKVMGGYVIATGILTAYVAATTFRRHERGSTIAVALGGAASIGTMAVVNVVLDSDFKKPLVGLSALLGLALVLHSRGR